MLDTSLFLEKIAAGKTTRTATKLQAGDLIIISLKNETMAFRRETCKIFRETARDISDDKFHVAFIRSQSDADDLCFVIESLTGLLARSRPGSSKTELVYELYERRHA